MSKIRMVDVLLLVVILVAFRSCFYWSSAAVNYSFKRNIDSFVENLKIYLNDHNGILPVDQSEFEKLSEGMLSFVYKINTNIKINNLRIKNNKLYDTSTGKQIWIIQRPKLYDCSSSSYIKLLENADLAIYEEMLKYKIQER